MPSKSASRFRCIQLLAKEHVWKLLAPPADKKRKAGDQDPSEPTTSAPKGKDPKEPKGKAKSKAKAKGKKKGEEPES